MNNEIKSIKIIPGQPVEGDDFFGREKELELLKEKLSNGLNIIIPGPRRWGKTSFVKEFFRRKISVFKDCYINLHETPSIKSFCDLFIDMRRITDLKSFILEIKEKFIKKNWNSLMDLIPELKTKDVEIKIGKFKEKDNFEQLNALTVIFELFPKYKVILVLDEISDFIIELEKKNKDEAINFLKWLRVLRQDLNVQMILTGSVNITSALQKLKLESLIGDMYLFKLKPLKQDESNLFLKSLLKSKEIEIKGEAFDFCIPKIQNGVHYFIQLFADEISINCQNKIIESKEEISQIYNDLIDVSRASISDFKTRLTRYLTDTEEKAAKKILVNLADNTLIFDDIFPLAGSILSDDKQHLADILQRLCDEGYLIEKNNKYSFISPILADYWLKHCFHEK